MHCSHKGGVSFNAESFGLASHSGYPELGSSAITPLVKFMTDLENYPWPSDPVFGNSTMNIGLITGGVAANVVPDYARAFVFIRAAVTASIVQNAVIQLAAPYNLTLTFSALFSPFTCSTVPGFQTEIFSYGTGTHDFRPNLSQRFPITSHLSFFFEKTSLIDLPSFQGSHKSYLFGPGSILVAHTDAEYINKSELTAAIGDYKTLITAILAQD